MNLDEQLRAALIQEADMQDAPRPDVDRLISGGQGRRRRRNLARLGIAAAVTVLVAGGALAATQLDPGTAHEPARPSRPETTPQPLPLDGGNGLGPDSVYRVLVSVGASGATIEADLTLTGVGWIAGNYPTLPGATYGGVGVYRPLALGRGSGCEGDAPSTDVAGSTQALARQLARLPQSTVLQEPTPEQAFGHDAVHVRLRVDSQCPADEGYRVAETLRGSRGISYGDVHRDVVIDLWVVQVDGVAVVVDAWHQEGSSSQRVDQIARTSDKITFVTGG